MDEILYTKDTVLKPFYDAYNYFMDDMKVINGKWEDIGADYFRDIVIRRTSDEAQKYHAAVDFLERQMQEILNKASALTDNYYTIYQPY